MGGETIFKVALVAFASLTPLALHGCGRVDPASFTPGKVGSADAPSVDRVPADRIRITKGTSTDPSTYTSQVHSEGTDRSRVIWTLVGKKGPAKAERSYALQVTVAYIADVWRVYASAHDADGRRLQVSPIDQGSINCKPRSVCQYDETFEIALTAPQMLNAGRNDVRITVFDRFGHPVFISVPAALTRELADKMADANA
ncbi:MAG TPA: hypothetical protein VD978_11145 [Azospirillum sp.]|nr:hypothetical protein [Azospirillum sp.]